MASFKLSLAIKNSGQGRTPCSNDASRPVLVILEDIHWKCSNANIRVILFISMNTYEEAQDTFGIL